MALSDIVPWRSGGLRQQDERPFDIFRDEMESLHRGLDRLFEDAWGGAFAPGLMTEPWTSRSVMPRLDVAEDDRAFRVAVELPGLSEKDVSVSLADRTLTIRGEKKQEKELKDRNIYRSERAYGAFRRVFEVPTDVDADKIEASFRNGVLTIDLPKTKEAQEKIRQIPVKTN